MRIFSIRLFNVAVAFKQAIQMQNGKTLGNAFEIVKRRNLTLLATPIQTRVREQLTSIVK